jgi:nucleoside-diphosphate-sugar epimerase
MSTVLLTGATGLVGVHARAALESAGHRVIAVARHGAPVIADLLDASQRKELIAAQRPSHWLHLAWETRHAIYWTAPDNEAWLAASRDLLKLFIAAGGERAVMAGTCAEYDWTKLSRAPVAEDAPLGPTTVYGRCKIAFAEALMQSGVSAANGRIFLLIGPGEHPDRLAPSIARALISGKPAECTAGSQIRDFIHPRDAGEALAALALSKVSGAVNIGTGVPHSVREVAQALGRVAGRPDLLRLGALPSRPDDPPFLVADTARLRNEVGYAPKISFEEMLADAYQWWLTRGDA